MNKKQILPLTDLTFYQQYLEELIDLFQSYLQEIEIVIDDHL